MVFVMNVQKGVDNILSKRERLEKIKNILKQNNIGTQKELMEALKKEGINVVQATLSRDLKE